jgi:two-component system OmpR family response regulator
VTRLETPQGNPSVLLVSDDDGLRRELCPRLEALGLRPTAVSSVPIDEWSIESPSVVVVDLGSVDVSTEPEQRCTTTARRPRWLYLARGQDATERVTLLRAGADDVMSRPLDVGELCLRVEKLVARPCVPRPTRLVVGDLVLDEEAREVEHAGRRLRLSPTEFGVLRLLVRNCGVVVSKDSILRDVWGYEDCGDGHVVELYISYLRKKLGREGSELIRTVRGAGYLVPSVAPPAMVVLDPGRAPVPAVG